MEDESQIKMVIHGVRYKDEASMLLHTEMKKAEAILEEKARKPKSVREALTIRDALKWPTKDTSYTKWLLEDKKAGHFDEGEWVGQTPEELAQGAIDFIDNEEYLSKKNHDLEEAVNQIMETIIDKGDKQNIQMVVCRDTTIESFQEEAYFYLVVFPLEYSGGQASRKREMSFLTAMCHTTDAIALLDDSLIAKLLDKSEAKRRPVEFQAGEKKFVAKNYKVPVTSEDELKKQLTETVKTHGRTPLDRLMQAGFGVIDKLKRRGGEHIDPLSALRDQEYAIRYALACHMGIGYVANERIVLPPIS